MGILLWFQVLFREQGILSFFHAGKMTTHHAKIPHFCCSYFRPCAFTRAGQAGFQHCAGDRSRVNIPRFRCSYSQLVCVCLDRIRQAIFTHHSLHMMHVKIPCFCCGYFQTVLLCPLLLLQKISKTCHGKTCHGNVQELRHAIQSNGPLPQVVLEVEGGGWGAEAGA